MKTCTGCNVEKPLAEFHKKEKWYESRCKECINERKRVWRKNNPHIVKTWNKRRNPGWDVERYDQYVELQGNRCAICGTDQPGLADWCCDHDHDKLTARGLLCVQCNAGLGYFKDNPEHLQSAINYLNKWR